MRRALVTGAGGRLGREMALALGARGIGVAVHYARSAQGAAAVVDTIRSGGGVAEALQADLLRAEDRSGLIARAAASLNGPIDILINNASIFEPDTIETATPESWDRHIGSNLRAPFELTQSFAAQAPAPIRDSDGEPIARASVINMIDQRVLKPVPDFLTYGIAKAGLWAFTRMAAQALAPAIRVNGIGPGPTLRGHRQSDAHFRAQRRATLLERGGDPADVVAAMWFLIDSASVTGQLICTDGGQHLAWQTPDVQVVE